MVLKFQVFTQLRNQVYLLSWVTVVHTSDAAHTILQTKNTSQAQKTDLKNKNNAEMRKISRG